MSVGIVDGRQAETVFDAIVTLIGGQIESREIKPRRALADDAQNGSFPATDRAHVNTKSERENLYMGPPPSLHTRQCILC